MRRKGGKDVWTVWKAKQPGAFRFGGKSRATWFPSHTKTPLPPHLPISASNAARDQRPERRGAVRPVSTPSTARLDSPASFRLPASRPARSVARPVSVDDLTVRFSSPPSAALHRFSPRNRCPFLGFRCTPAACSPDRMSWQESWNP